MHLTPRGPLFIPEMGTFSEQGPYIHPQDSPCWSKTGCLLPECFFEMLHYTDIFIFTFLHAKFSYKRGWVKVLEL